MSTPVSTDHEAEAHDQAESDGSGSHLTLSWILSHPLVGAAAVSSAGAGLVHAAAAGTHSTERVAAVLFAATAVLQVAWAFYYVAHPTRILAIIGLVVNGMFAAMWVLSRTVGLPFPEAMAGVDHVSAQDSIAAMLGLVSAVCAAVAVWRSDQVSRHRAGSILTASAISVVVVLFAVVGIAAPHSHGPASSDHGGMAMAPAEAGATTPGSMPGMDTGSMPGMDTGSMPGMEMPGMDMGSMSSGQPAQTPAQVVGPAGALSAADVRFAHLMVARRGQAIRMADLALANTTNTDVLTLAALIKADTAPDVYRMEDALRAADQPPADPFALSAGSPSGPTGGGLLTEADLVKLENAYGESFDAVFLGFLVRHHDGAITSAGQLLGNGGGTATRGIARDLIISSASQREAIAELDGAVVELDEVHHAAE